MRKGLRIWSVMRSYVEVVVFDDAWIESTARLRSDSIGLRCVIWFG